MIDLAVRHYVLDLCLGIMFEKFSSNMQMNNNGIPKPGQYFSRISHVTDEEHYYDCIITDVEKRSNGPQQDFYIIYFRYQSSDGEDLQDWLEEMKEINELYEAQENGSIDEDQLEQLELYEEEDDDFDDEGEIELYQLEGQQVGVNSFFYVFIP